jgi:hypothetical protein
MKKIILLTIPVTCLLIMSACNKQLSEPPPNAKVNGTIIVDLKSAQVALNGVYYQFANMTPTIYQWQNQNVLPSMLTGMLGYGAGTYTDESNLNLNSRFMQISNPWGQWYESLTASNGFLEALNITPPGVVPQARATEMTAEARFVRAYAHFKLLMFFAEWNDLNSKKGVLLRKELGGLSSAVRKRNTVAESYDFILEDLDYAVANGPTTNPNHNMNKYAAMILQARVLLTRGLAADITKALSLTNQVINSGKYTLENNLKDIYHVKGLASSEVILGVKAQILQETKRETTSGPYYHSATYASTPYRAKKVFRDTLLNGDPRQTWMVGPATNSTTSPGTYFFSKFLPYVGAIANVPTQLSETSYAMRLSEVYLLKAEAIARSGGDLNDAKTQIKTVMTKAGVSNFSAVDAAASAKDVWIQVYYETLRQFTGEDGIDWFALLRFPFDTIKQLRPTITLTSQLWFGVPVSEFQVNPLFGDQNAGGYPTQ